MKIKNKLIKAVGLGVAILAAPAAIWIANVGNTPKPTGAYTTSNYLQEKGYLDCKDKCSELKAGYDWAKDNNICEPKYNNSSSESYNIGVQAWAWDECAYSRDGKPI